MADKGERNLVAMDKAPADKDIPDITGWGVKDSKSERVGRVSGLLIDKPAEKVRYIKVRLEDNNESQNVIIPVGLLKKSGSAELQTTDIDKDIIAHSPIHSDGSTISYKDEMSIRAYFEEPDKVDSKLSAEKEENYRTGAGPGHSYTDTETSYKENMETNARYNADVLQGEYKPNLQGGPEGVQKRAINPEGKHDIPASSGNPEDARRGDGGTDGDQITSDKPGATLGSDEQNDPGKDRRISREKPNIPENANKDFYRHPMFNDEQLRQ